MLPLWTVWEIIFLQEESQQAVVEEVHLSCAGPSDLQINHGSVDVTCCKQHCFSSFGYNIKLHPLLQTLMQLSLRFLNKLNRNSTITS